MTQPTPPNTPPAGQAAAPSKPDPKQAALLAAIELAKLRVQTLPARMTEANDLVADAQAIATFLGSSS